MNKKFSTLMLGMLLTSAFASAQMPFKIGDLQEVDFKDQKVVDGTYIVVSSSDNSLSGNDRVLSVVKSNGALEYKAWQIGAESATHTDPSAYKWTLEVFNEKSGSVFYALKNAETGTYLTFANNQNNDVPVTDPSKSEKAEKTDDNSSLFAQAFNAAGSPWKNGNKLYLWGPNLYNTLYFDGSVKTGSSENKIILCQFKANDLNNEDGAATLNKVKGGEGFNFEFSVDNKDAWSNDILTDLNLKAFYVSEIAIDDDNNLYIPKGIYFASEYPASLIGEDVIADAADFKACTFVAVNPDVNYGINKAEAKNGIGFELMTVSGSAMNFYKVEDADDENENASEKGDVYVGNACFTVTEPDPLNGEGEYNLSLANFRYLADDTKTAHVNNENALYIGCINDQSENFLVTTEEDNALAFTTTNSTVYDVTKLLKSEDAPSIYTFQFVSDVNKDETGSYAGEKGQYLTVGRNESGSGFVLSAVEEMNSEDPMFQFVISGIDKENKTVEFTNRQTGYDFEVSLYENTDGSFTIYPAIVNLALSSSKFDNSTENGVVEFKSGKLQNTKVILTEVAVEDKFATFANRPEGAGLVTFELAKNIDDTPDFYLGADKDNDGNVKAGNLLAYTDEMTQFELVKDEEPLYVVNNYVYLKDTRVWNSTEKDTVYFYTYKIKAFTADNSDLYVGWANDQYVLSSKDADARDFVIKTNVDGSVSLIDYYWANYYNTTLANKDIPYAYVDATGDNWSVKDPEAAWTDYEYYNLAAQLSEGLKTFMVEEKSISYETVPQHVSFEAVRGGFMTKDENNDAVLSISNTASEDLTFWLDTVHSDYAVPYFYILKNGSFMYNAADSAKTYNAKDNYRFNLEDKKYSSNPTAKLIFKAGELVTSDTLRTMVDGQSVLVAEKDNAPKKVKGGLHNFHFQIIQAEEGSDEYVIRQDAKYVGQYNNYFYMVADKDAAYRFVIEKQAAPTANEDIEVSEVKVIAGNGQITIMGAAGKKVVVSNILGKVVASQTISSDNATIAVPAGIVAVAVEGEAAVKAVVK